MKLNRVRLVAFVAVSLFAGLSLASCSGSNSGESASTESTAANGKLPVFTLSEESTYDFGKVTDGEIVEKSFAFKNTGEAPLVISNISASCGCTTPEWPKDPIAPGGESNILVKFNSTGKPGPQNKTVTITANTEPSVIELHIKGIVEAKN